MRRTIFHVDVNSAFLSWSAVKKLREEPGSVDLRTIPSAVGGDVSTRHGIITARSIPAKKFGIKTAMPVIKALELCPNLVMIQSDFETYRRFSAAFIEILKKYGGVVEQASIDEAYVDMTGQENLIEKAAAGRYSEPFPINAALLIKNEIRDTLGFTVNIGISENKLLAKMASDFQKPDRIHTLYPEEVPEKMWPLPIGDLFGCGSKSAERLRHIGVFTIGDAAKLAPELLIPLLGNAGGTYIHEAANGRSDSIVTDEREEAKSISNELTTSYDIDEKNLSSDGEQILRLLAEKVSKRLKSKNFYAGTIGFGVKTDDFRRRSIQRKLDDTVNDEDTIYQVSRKLMDELLLGEKGLFRQGVKIRLFCISATGLDHGEFRQMTLFDFAQKKAVERKENEKRERLNLMTRAIQEKYGRDAVHKGFK